MKEILAERLSFCGLGNKEKVAATRALAGVNAVAALCIGSDKSSVFSDVKALLGQKEFDAIARKVVHQWPSRRCSFPSI